MFRWLTGADWGQYRRHPRAAVLLVAPALAALLTLGGVTVYRAQHQPAGVSEFPVSRPHGTKPGSGPGGSLGPVLISPARTGRPAPPSSGSASTAIATARARSTPPPPRTAAPPPRTRRPAPSRTARPTPTRSRTPSPPPPTITPEPSPSLTPPTAGSP